MTIFTCARCGAQGDPPSCDHFQQPWSTERIAEVCRIVDADAMSQKQLLIELAGYLTLLANGTIVVPDHARREAADLIEKIGKAVASMDAAQTEEGN